MPHFNEEGHETYICQVCASILDAEKFPASWRPDLTGYSNAGNICGPCLHKKNQEHDAADVVRYMNRVLRASEFLPVLAELEKGGKR